ncbi:MAG TPA: TIGR04282 family arsenosugar biosynthesis glycosyltransferase [Longimicrobiales bacterium]|nr:TIGR04282 family arsenosugar biosynthesis glycosyltransferase [Longimicrobiales bacterium]
MMLPPEARPPATDARASVPEAAGRAPLERLVVFARRPDPGHVKLRLSPPLPREAGAEVYEACLRDVLAGALAEAPAVEIAYHDTRGAGEWFGATFPDVPARPQAAGDPGVKLTAALEAAFGAGAERAVVVGTDAPGLPRGRLRQAFGALRSGDAVLGPTDDGGHYLLGFRRPAWAAARPLFEGVPWGTGRVFRSFRKRALAASVRVTTLPLWYEVDQVADLARVAPYIRADTHLGRWLAGPMGRRYVARR